MLRWKAAQSAHGLGSCTRMYTALFRRFPPCLASTGDFFNSLLKGAEGLNFQKNKVEETRTNKPGVGVQAVTSPGDL
jgi:hypothetical protein